jgi:hypothetical protein
VRKHKLLGITPFILAVNDCTQGHGFSHPLQYSILARNMPSSCVCVCMENFTL